MDVEMWNINLHYKDGKQGQRVLQRSIDRDIISYFELVGLIEQVGFQAIDYMYYKKIYPHGRGYLVHIDNDSHVRKMISEHETKRSVQLYVFKERSNIDIAPSDPPSEDNSLIAGLEDGGVFEEGAVLPRMRRPQKKVRRSKKLNVIQSSVKYTNGYHNTSEISLLPGEPMPETQVLEDKEDCVEHQDNNVLSGDVKVVDKRGRTTLLAVWNMPEGERIVVKCNTLGQPIGEEGGVLGKFLGTIARLGGYRPLDKKDWRDVKKHGGAETILQCVQAISEKNKTSRAMVKTTHTAGTKSYARWAEDLRQEDPEKKQPHRAKVYLATHRKNTKDKNEHVVELERLIDKQPELAQNDRGKVAWKGDALHQVLGNEKLGQVHGMGMLPIPKQVYGRTPCYLKNINMTTRSGSSSEGEIEIREEISKLKQHIEEQAQIIQALKNKDEGNGNNETDGENFQTIDNGRSQPLVHAKRKRVHCNEPDPVRSLIEQRNITSNKKTILRQHDMCKDNDAVLLGEKHPEYEGHNQLLYQAGSSSPPHPNFDFLQEMRKNKEMDDNLRRPQEQDTQNKTLGYMPSKQRHTPSMKVGTVVILKSSTHRNKRRVAYATILGYRSNTLVGGVELGGEFMHVRVDQPIAEDEALVRERENCKTIGDAFTSRLTIAWPSASIEKING